MSRIPTPVTIADAPAAAQPHLQAVEKKLGSVPNLFRLVATSPKTLDAFLGFSGALSTGALPAATRERIALAVAQINGCDYCLAAHSYVGRNLAGLDAAEIAANRAGGSTDPKAAAAVAFAAKLVTDRGAVSQEDVVAVRNAGYSDAQILEIIGHVALNTFTNYVNEALGTEVDFPAAETLAA